MNWKGKKIGRQVFCLCALFIASGADAAEQGLMGSMSSGSISISVSIAPQATLSGLGNIDLENATTDRFPRSLCLSSNSLARSYTVTVMGSGHADLFELSNGAQDTDHGVNWAAQGEELPGKSGNGFIQLQAAASEAECALGLGSADLIFRMDPANRHAVQAGAPLSGALTLIIAPE